MSRSRDLVWSAHAKPEFGTWDCRRPHRLWGDDPERPVPDTQYRSDGRLRAGSGFSLHRPEHECALAVGEFSLSRRAQHRSRKLSRDYGKRPAVRAGPGTNHPLVSEFLIGRGEPTETTLLRDEVRLSAGHVVQASLEPIIVDETTWVAVDNVPQAGQTREDTPIWRSVAPVPYSEIDFQLTWIAVARQGATFAELTDQPACSDCYGDLPVPVAVASGVGDGRIGPWTNRDVAWITIAAASSSSSSTRVPHGEPDGEPMFINDPAVEYVETLIPGVSPAPTASPEAEVWLDVSGDCAWSAKVYVTEG